LLTAPFALRLCSERPLGRGRQLGLMAKPPYYTKEGADILFRMQVRATQSILTATTALSMIAVEKAINAILAAVKVAVNQAVKFALV